MVRNRSLVIASLELGRVLADRGKVTFRAQGTCMFPCVQPGDVLQIESRSIEQVQVDNIAVFRREDSLFGHRAIAKGTCDGRPYILTRPDRTRHGNDGPLFAADVLGVVTAIERRGVKMPLYPQPLRGVATLRAAAWEWWNWNARPRLIESVGILQHRTWYRHIASVWFTVIVRPRFSFVVRVPLTANQSHDLYREMLPETFDVSQTSQQGKPVTRWLLALHLDGACAPAASATITWHPADCPRGAGWRIDEMQIRVRYRGMGLEDTLIHQAEMILVRSGMALQRIPK